MPGAIVGRTRHDAALYLKCQNSLIKTRTVHAVYRSVIATDLGKYCLDTADMLTVAGTTDRHTKSQLLSNGALDVFFSGMRFGWLSGFVHDDITRSSETRHDLIVGEGKSGDVDARGGFIDSQYSSAHLSLSECQCPYESRLAVSHPDIDSIACVSALSGMYDRSPAILHDADTDAFQLDARTKCIALWSGEHPRKYPCSAGSLDASTIQDDIGFIASSQVHGLIRQRAVVRCHDECLIYFF